MSKTTNTKAKATDKTVKKIQVSQEVNALLNVENGYTSKECIEAINNKQLKAAVLSYAKAVESGRKSGWNVARAAARMKVEARKEFGSDETLAHFLGLANKGSFNKLRRAGELADQAELLGLTITAVQELLVIEGEKYGKQNAQEHLSKIADMTKDEVRDYVSKFKVAQLKTEKPRKQLPDKKSKTPEVVEGNIIEGNINEQPTEHLDLAAVWVNKSEWNALEQTDRDKIVSAINELFESYNMGCAVLS